MSYNESMLCATWTLAIFTIALTGATAAYAWITFKMLKSSDKQQEIMRYHNSIVDEQNRIMKEQTESIKYQTEALYKQADMLNFIKMTIESLPYEQDRINNPWPPKSK